MLCYGLSDFLPTRAYGGAYAYGKTGAATVYDGSAARQGVRRKPREDWLALRPGAHKGYVAWERSETIRQMISLATPRAENSAAWSSMATRSSPAFSGADAAGGS